MFVIVLASQKGGAGKTTLCGHLAVEAERTGAGPVAIIDTDPQASLAKWRHERAAKAPHLVPVEHSGLAPALGQLRNDGFRLVFIDTPPANTDFISEVIGHADLVIIPTKPSPHDLRAVGATVGMADRQRKPLIFVINDATPRARITAETAVALSQHGVVAPVMLHHRTDFAASMVDGRTVGEASPKSISAQEVCELWTYVHTRLIRPLGNHVSDATESAWPVAEETDFSAPADSGGDEAAAPEAPTTAPEQSPPRQPLISFGRLPRARENALFHHNERALHPFGRRQNGTEVK